MAAEAEARISRRIRGKCRQPPNRNCNLERLTIRAAPRAVTFARGTAVGLPRVRNPMRHFIASALLIGAAMPAGIPAARAASFPHSAARTSDVVIDVQARQRQGRDCTPYNGPFGFYGNIWCQPTSESSYL